MTPLRAIATEIASARGYTLAELLAWDRRDPVARARHAAMLAQHRAGHTYAAIARFWGARSQHSQPCLQNGSTTREGKRMKQAILTAMTREFQEDRSLCPMTYRAMRAVVETHGEAIGGNNAAEQVVNSEAKATITLQNCIGTGKAVALSLCAHDHLSSKSGKIMSVHKDSLHTSEQGQ